MLGCWKISQRDGVDKDGIAPIMARSRRCGFHGESNEVHCRYRRLCASCSSIERLVTCIHVNGVLRYGMEQLFYNALYHCSGIKSPRSELTYQSLRGSPFAPVAELDLEFPGRRNVRTTNQAARVS